jgi:hypothetical protein
MGISHVRKTLKRRIPEDRRREDGVDEHRAVDRRFTDNGRRPSTTKDDA